MHISLRCVIRKKTSKLKTPSLLVDPVIKPAPSVWKNSQKLRGSAPQLASPSWDAPLSPRFTQTCFNKMKPCSCPSTSPQSTEVCSKGCMVSGHQERFGEVWRPLFLWFPVPPATDSKALGIHSARSKFVFKANAIQKIFPIFHQTFSWTDLPNRSFHDLNKFQVYP